MRAEEDGGRILGTEKGENTREASIERKNARVQEIGGLIGRKAMGKEEKKNKGIGRKS